MPSTSSLVLLPPKQSVLDTSALATAVAPKDKSFEETLGEARQKSKKEQTTESTKKPASKPTTKSGKTSKPKDLPAETDDTEDTEVSSAAEDTGQTDKSADLPSDEGESALPVPVKKATVAKADSHADATATAVALTTPLKSEQTPSAPTAQDAKTAQKTSDGRAVVVAAAAPGDEKAAAEGSADGGEATGSADDPEAADAEVDADTVEGIAPVKGKALGVSGSNALNRKVEDDGQTNPATATTDSSAAASVANTSDADPSAGASIGRVIESDASPDADHVPALHESSTEPSISPAGQFHQTLQAASREIAIKEPSGTATPQTQFVEENHGKIITGVHGQLLPNGGSMQIRLDPPELGVLQVTVHMRDGVMTAAFETSNDDATHLLSHSLSQLKTALESSGVSVEKLHVQQGARQEGSKDSGDSEQKQNPQQQQQARQEQQRRELMQRMWRKLSGAPEPLDMVA